LKLETGYFYGLLEIWNGYLKLPGVQVQKELKITERTSLLGNVVIEYEFRGTWAILEVNNFVTIF